MDFDTIDTDIWFEIQDAPGEIFDVIPELQQEKFDFDAYINADYDFWWWTPTRWTLLVILSLFWDS